MFRQVVVGVEEDKGSRDAIAIARKLLARDGALTLAHVYTGYPHVYRGVSATHDSSERERALELLERTREESGVPADLRVRKAHTVGPRSARALRNDRGGPARGRLISTRAAGTGTARRRHVCRAERVAMRDRGRARRLRGRAGGNARDRRRLRRVVRERARAPVRPDARAGVGRKAAAFEAITLPSTALSTGPLPFDEMVSTLVAEARDRIAAHRATNDRICISTATLRSSGRPFHTPR